jgi:hypothetical protein
VLAETLARDQLNRLRATSTRLAFLCASDALYSSRHVRVDALRRSSREIVDGLRPNPRVIPRTLRPCAFEHGDVLTVGERQVAPDTVGDSHGFTLPA